MSESVSALTNQLVPGYFGLPGDPGVIIQEVVDFSLFQFAAWPQTLEQTGTLAALAIGAQDAPGPGQTINARRGTMLRIEPLKWWLLTANPVCIEFSELKAETGSVLDLSHSQAWLRVKGSKAATLLNHYLPIDLRPARVSEGTVVSTAFHHVGVTLYYTENEFNLFVPRSFAVSLWELMYLSALQYGLEVRQAESTFNYVETE